MAVERCIGRARRSDERARSIARLRPTLREAALAVEMLRRVRSAETIALVRVVLVFLGLTLAGCLDPTVEAPATEVCAAICACRTPLAHAQELCQSDCEAQVGGQFLPDACVTCARESACFELDDCLGNCFAVPAPVPEEEP